ncbi:hypothetical protein BDZ91DRAFT_751046 [Kalaharituber pfeilii]|nr:hypothetical protein BDZ91DRAFT_751046 [Kalaharituber pfeilii]
MVAVRTPVNGYQWPVPLPAGVALERVRDELLYFGGRYVWLDVLCLRQEAGSQCEEIRGREWKIDVPTIGNIYRTASRIDPRHWLQRVWTLQEVRSEDVTFNGGVQQDTVYLNTVGTFEGSQMTLRQAIAPLTKLARHLTQKDHCEIYRLAKEMQRRHASTAIDKVTGLFYLLRTSVLPTYSKDTAPGVAWSQSFHFLSIKTKLELLFDFPYRGSNDKWFPSWGQLLQWPDRDPAIQHRTRKVHLRTLHLTFPSCKHYDDDAQLISIEGVLMLWGITLTKSLTPGEYTGTISRDTVSPKAIRISFFSIYRNQQPIDDGRYVLVTPRLSTSQNWIVCDSARGSWEWEHQLCSENCALKPGLMICRKVGVLRTDAGIWLRGPDSLLQMVSCLFV